MARQPLVLLVPKDRLTGILTSNGLMGYGYDVLTAAGVKEAFDLLSTNPRISVLVINVEIENAFKGLALAKAARRDDPKIKVIYTCAIPNRLPEREKVSDAPCLRTPYHPHQLVGVIGQISNRYAPDEYELHAV
jgi:DNA-binding NtrC family response regulator